MTNDEHIAIDLLQFFNFAVLRRITPGHYAFVGHAPSFYEALYPSATGPSTAPWEFSPMLEFFLEEAERFFDQDEPGVITSGTWEEDGITREGSALMALAVNTGDDCLLILRLLEEEYTERVGVLRKARKQLLENRELASNLSFFREKSRIDGLTSIFNRTTFTELLHDEIKRSQILDYPLVIMILDIDDFKSVNDTYGHLIGDRVLQNMGSTLKASLRRNDIIARYGGEEFAVLLSHESMEQAAQIAEKIRANIASMVTPGAPHVTVSIGCALYAPDEPTEEFFQRADGALYEAKRTGKNKVCLG